MAEAREQRTHPEAPIIVHPNRERYWTRIIRQAGICTTDREHSGMRPTLEGVVDIDVDPVWCADQVTMANTMGLRLRSCTAALWLLLLRKSPNLIRKCGRTYSPSDCAPFMRLVDAMLENERITYWLVSYARGLAWNYEHTQGKQHSSAALLAALAAELIA